MGTGVDQVESSTRVRRIVKSANPSLLFHFCLRYPKCLCSTCPHFVSSSRDHLEHRSCPDSSLPHGLTLIPTWNQDSYRHSSAIVIVIVIVIPFFPLFHAYMERKNGHDKPSPRRPPGHMNPSHAYWKTLANPWVIGSSRYLNPIRRNV